METTVDREMDLSSVRPKTGQAKVAVKSAIDPVSFESMTTLPEDDEGSDG